MALKTQKAVQIKVGRRNKTGEIMKLSEVILYLREQRGI